MMEGKIVRRATLPVGRQERERLGKWILSAVAQRCIAARNNYFTTRG